MEKILEQLRSDAHGVANTTAHFMELAKKYIAEDNLEAAKACLLLLCDNCDNYEQSIEWNGLTETWQRYRYLVKDLVAPSVSTLSAEPLFPAECSMQIGDILSLPDDQLISALSEHLGELSGSGNELNCLNKWERTVYYIDELCSEVNSGGFDSYLYYHGTHFEKAYAALQSICANGVLSILDAVRSKFPKGRIPKSEDALQNTMDTLEENGIDFESEDAYFYSSGEKELLKSLLAYVTENKTHFR
ncbi:MAG: DUF4375 domain-containing protein [Oscillospiraceae bacterium]|nr:DUF4375 domain-containing protein [Oscillospiraceae bacterium]